MHKSIVKYMNNTNNDAKLQLKWAISEIRGTPLKKTNIVSAENLGIPRLEFYP